MRTPTQSIRLVHEKINPLPTLEDPLDILRHDIPHIVHLFTRRSQCICRRCRVVCGEQRQKFAIESRATVRGERREIGGRWWIDGEEPPLHLEEEGKGDAPALFGRRDDHVAQC